jgi:hypothetical protein
LKKLLFVILFSLTVVAQQSPETSTPASSPAAQQPGSEPQTTVVVFREKHFEGSALKPSIYVDDKEITRLNNGSYFTLPIKPGKHTLNSSAKHEAPLEIDVKAGEGSYIQMIVVAGTWRGAGRLVPVPAEAGKNAISKLKPLELK